MRILTVALLFAAMMALGAAPAFAEDTATPQQAPSTAQKAKQAIKDGAHAVGRTTRKVTRAIGHGARDTTKAIGHGTRDAVHGVGDAAEKAWDGATR